MSDTVQLVVVALAVFAAAVYLVRKWRRPEKACDSCPAEPAAPRPLIQLGRGPRSTGSAPRPPSAS